MHIYVYIQPASFHDWRLRNQVIYLVFLYIKLKINEKMYRFWFQNEPQKGTKNYYFWMLIFQSRHFSPDILQKSTSRRRCYFVPFIQKFIKIELSVFLYRLFLSGSWSQPGPRFGPKGKKWQGIQNIHHFSVDSSRPLWPASAGRSVFYTESSSVSLTSCCTQESWILWGRILYKGYGNPI